MKLTSTIALLSRVTMAELVATKNKATSALALLAILVFSVKTKNRVATPQPVTIAPCVRMNLVRVSSLVSAERATLDPTVAALWIHVQTTLAPTLPNAFHSNKAASSAFVQLAGRVPSVTKMWTIAPNHLACWAVTVRISLTISVALAPLVLLANVAKPKLIFANRHPAVITVNASIAISALCASANRAGLVQTALFRWMNALLTRASTEVNAKMLKVITTAFALWVLLVKTANTMWTTVEANRASMAALALIHSRASSANVDLVSLAFNAKLTSTSAWTTLVILSARIVAWIKSINITANVGQDLPAPCARIRLTNAHLFLPVSTVASALSWSTTLNALAQQVKFIFIVIF